MKIVIIDDSKDQRETMSRLMRSVLTDNWEVVDIEPFQNLSEYPTFIHQEEIGVIILDEKLKTSSSVNYEGHDVVKYIRERLHTLPIYVITSFEEDTQLSGSFSEVEEIIGRQKFSNEIEKYYPRIIRAGQHFIETFKSDLSDLNTISQKIVTNEASEEEIMKAQAIQAKLNLAYGVDEFNQRSLILDKLETKLGEFADLKSQIDQLLNSDEMD